jgi:hypothetical protein
MGELLSTMYYTLPVDARQFVYSKTNYHPLYGDAAVVDTPHINVNTRIPTVVKELDQLGGDPRNHFILNPMYKQAYMAMRELNWKEDSREYQLDPYHHRPIQGTRLINADGTEVHSRVEPSQRKPQKSEFFNAAKGKGISQFNNRV